MPRFRREALESVEIPNEEVAQTKTEKSKKGKKAEKPVAVDTQVSEFDFVEIVNQMISILNEKINAFGTQIDLLNQMLVKAQEAEDKNLVVKYIIGADGIPKIYISPKPPMGFKTPK